MISEKFNPDFPAMEDGFAIEDGPSWTSQKNRLIQHFITQFNSTQQRKFDYRVFVDLFAGSGLKKTDVAKVEHGSAVKALELNNSFSKYILNEREINLSSALRVRTNKYFRDKNIVIFNEDPNALMEKLHYYIPDSTERHKVSTLCLLDISSLDLEFDTIKILSELGIHFLVVVSIPLLASRDFKTYCEDEREKLNAFIGKSWMEIDDQNCINSNEAFFRQLIKTYHQGFKQLGYDAKGSFYRINESKDELPYFFCGYYRGNQQKPTRNVHPVMQKKLQPETNMFELYSKTA